MEKMNMTYFHKGIKIQCSFYNALSNTSVKKQVLFKKRAFRTLFLKLHLHKENRYSKCKF